MQAFMEVLITCKYEKDRTRNTRGNVVTMYFRRSIAANSVVSCPNWPKLELVQAFMEIFITRKYEKDRITNARKSVNTVGLFSPIRQEYLFVWQPEIFLSRPVSQS